MLVSVYTHTFERTSKHASAVPALFQLMHDECDAFICAGNTAITFFNPQ